MPTRRPAPLPPRPTAARWRRPALAITLALAVFAGYHWWTGGRSSPLALDSSRETLVFLGDSITSGHGLPLEVTFAHRLGQALGVGVQNAGISGDTTAGALRRLGTDVLAHRPKLVVVELGANDVFRRVPREQTSENVRAIVRRLREDGAGVLLIHVRLGAWGGDALESYREIARSEGAWLVENFLDDVVPNLTTDGLHPTAEGHARLAARLEPVLREILAR